MMTQIKQIVNHGIIRWNTLRRAQTGQALVEYALILALIAVVAIAGLTALGNTVKNELHIIGQSIINASS